MFFLFDEIGQTSRINLDNDSLFSTKGNGPRYCPISCPYYGKEVDYTEVYCPNTERLCKEAVWVEHPVLLAEKEDMKDIARAIVKIRENLKEIKGSSP